jgi:hypothetical protein
MGERRQWQRLMALGLFMQAVRSVATLREEKKVPNRFTVDKWVVTHALTNATCDRGRAAHDNVCHHWFIECDCKAFVKHILDRTARIGHWLPSGRSQPRECPIGSPRGGAFGRADPPAETTKTT